MQKHLTKQEQEEHVKRWQQSGLSKNAYALKAGVNPRTFIGWTWLKEKKKAKGFAELPKKVYSYGLHEIVIEKRGMKILLPATIDTEQMKKIFTVLGGTE